MKNFPKIITQDNFNEAAELVLRAENSIKKNELTKKIVKPVSSILFVFFSFLFTYGALYINHSPEEAIVFARLTPITKAWSFFSGLLTTPDMAWYVLAGVLIVAAFVLPLVFSALIKLIVSLALKPNAYEFSDGGTAQNAKKLHSLAEKIYKNSSNYEDGSAKTPYKIIFVVLIAALLIYAFIALKMLMAWAITGFIICMVILYFVYGLIFSGFYALNSLFYKKAYIPNVTGITEKYWLSVDTAEANRRAEQAKKNKAKQEATRKKAQTTYTPPKASTKIDEYDSFTWTADYVRNNENKCSDVSLSVLNVSKELLAEGDYSGAAAGFDKVVRGLELLSTVDNYYLPPLFANCYALAKIFACGLNNKDSAVKYSKKACEYARKCGTEAAKRDLYVMQDFCDTLSSSSSLSAALNQFDIDFPADILR